MQDKKWEKRQKKAGLTGMEPGLQPERGSLLWPPRTVYRELKDFQAPYYARKEGSGV